MPSSDDSFKSVNSINMFDRLSQSKENNSNISKININSGNNSLNSIKIDNIKNLALIFLYKTNIIKIVLFQKLHQIYHYKKIQRRKNVHMLFIIIFILIFMRKKIKK